MLHELAQRRRMADAVERLDVLHELLEQQLADRGVRLGHGAGDDEQGAGRTQHQLEARHGRAGEVETLRARGRRGLGAVGLVVAVAAVVFVEDFPQRLHFRRQRRPETPRQVLGRELRPRRRWRRTGSLCHRPPVRSPPAITIPASGRRTPRRGLRPGPTPRPLLLLLR